MSRWLVLKNSVAFVTLMVSISCLIVLFLTMLKLPDISSPTTVRIGTESHRTIKTQGDININDLGKLGELMVDMLPQDLAFTVFVPSSKAFNRDLRLSENDSMLPHKFDDTYATISRILGFSAVPRAIPSISVPFEFGKHISYDSLSGFALYMSKETDGMLVVNRVRSERVDLKTGEIVVHIMDGVIMDSEFEQSVLTDEE